MAEPTVPVPVSLIERAIRAIRVGYGDMLHPDLVAELRALVSQPTPTAEQYTPEDGPAPWGYLDTDRIADMVPGTTFTATPRQFFTVAHPLAGSWIAKGSNGGMWTADEFDPSTIRDVTPPTN